MILLFTREKDISHNIENKVYDGAEVLVVAVFFQDNINWVHAEENLLNLYKSGNMIFERSCSKLLEIILANDHVLDEGGQLLMELYDIWLLVHEVLQLYPVFVELIVGFLEATSECVHKLNKHNSCFHRLRLRLFDSQNFCESVQLDLFEGVLHASLDVVLGDGLDIYLSHPLTWIKIC